MALIVPIIVCDLDGTLADTAHRNHYLQQDPPDWPSCLSECENDKLNLGLAALLTRLHTHIGPVYFITGREEQYREPTERWLDSLYGNAYAGLFMRPNGDRRESLLTKNILVQELLNSEWGHPYLAFEDSQRDAAMYQGLGFDPVIIQCLEGE